MTKGAKPVPGQRSLFSFFQKPATNTTDQNEAVTNPAASKDILSAQNTDINRQHIAVASSPIKSVQQTLSPVEKKSQQPASSDKIDKPPSISQPIPEPQIPVDKPEHQYTKEPNPPVPTSPSPTGTITSEHQKGNAVSIDKNITIDETNGQTAYELERAERIRRNMEVMRNLGLGNNATMFTKKQAGGADRKKSTVGNKRKKVAKEFGIPEGPVRRSARHTRGGDATTATANEADNNINKEQQPQEEELNYDASTVHKYVCEILSSKQWQHEQEGATKIIPESTAITGFGQLPVSFYDHALAKAYTIDYRPGIVVAAGKDGQTSIWGTCINDEENENEVEPLLSCRLHRSWISDVQFVGGHIGEESSGNDNQSMLLLSAANDGTVCLWDIGQTGTNQQQRTLPKEVYKATHLHSSGVFSMHEHGSHIVTGSKDKSAVHSRILGTGSIEIVKEYEDLHDGVVKCVRWQPNYPLVSSSSSFSDIQQQAPVVFASCGNDRLIKIVDTRTGNLSEMQLEGHNTAVNCIRWSPCISTSSHHMLLSASHDPSVLLHDLRNPSNQLYSFIGHSLDKRIATIYQPAWAWGGDAVVVACDKTLSLYCCKTGATISRGTLSCSVGATFSSGKRGDALYCTSNRSVLMFTPRWE